LKKLKLLLLAAEIEWHWRIIEGIRRKGSSVLTEGTALTSRKLLILNRRLSRHSAKTIKKQAAYEMMMESMD